MAITWDKNDEAESAGCLCVCVCVCPLFGTSSQNKAHNEVFLFFYNMCPVHGYVLAQTVVVKVQQRWWSGVNKVTSDLQQERRCVRLQGVVGNPTETQWWNVWMFPSRDLLKLCHSPLLLIKTHKVYPLTTGGGSASVSDDLNWWCIFWKLESAER